MLPFVHLVHWCMSTSNFFVTFPPLFYCQPLCCLKDYCIIKKKKFCVINRCCLVNGSGWKLFHSSMEMVTTGQRVRF